MYSTFSPSCLNDRSPTPRWVYFVRFFLVHNHSYHFVERSYGKTIRSIRLPDTADVSKASAAYVDGVLRLNFPKMDPPAARRLQIPVGDGEEAS